MDIENSLKKLFALHNFGVKLGLDNIKNFLNYLGNPQENIKAIHIAGSNGKGSTASFIASILMERGYKTGLYTSPHFVDFNERIIVDRVRIPNNYVAEFVSEYEDFIYENHLTFFEVTTAMAFLYFGEMKTDYCVVETGLGGRLDATNVLSPLAAVITSISLEHTNVLGETIPQIALEKAGIIKTGIKVFTGRMPGDAMTVFKNICQLRKCELHQLKNYITQGENNKGYIPPGSKMLENKISLRGSYQKDNAALASLVVSELDLCTDEITSLKGIEKVIENTGIQGRYEIINSEPTVILDAAHNPESVSNFLNEFDNEHEKYERKTLLFGAMRDKNIGEMLKSLSGYFEEIFISRINYERAAKAEDIVKELEALNLETKVIDNPVDFVKDFCSRGKDDCLVVLGSMYLLGEVKSGLLVDIT